MSLFGRIGGMAVDDSGRVFIADDREKTIYVFEPDGHFLTHVGRKGRGPGEFMYIMQPSIMNRHLFVYDLMLRRMNIYSLDSLKLVNTLNLNPDNRNKIPGLKDYSLFYIYPINGGKYIVSYGQLGIKSNTQSDNLVYIKFFVMNNLGKLRPHQILKQKEHSLLTGNVGGQIISADFEFLGHSLDVVSPDGSIYSAWSKDFLIKKYDSNGSYKYAIYHHYKKVKLTRDGAIKNQIIKGRNGVGYQRKMILQQNTLPKTWPVLMDMKIDDQDRLWVATVVQNMKVYQWWVLNKSGKIIARFDWPRNKPIKVIKNGNIYTQETDTATGISKIVRYRIEMIPLEK